MNKMKRMLLCLQIILHLWMRLEENLCSALSTENIEDVTELIQFDGYPLEIHHVDTEDGYILELHRIPRGRNEAACCDRRRKRVVFLAHCAMCSSAAYVVLGPKKGLAYMLANSGFDVWLLNARGNQYSRRHVQLSPESRKFWQFSWHEQGTFDVPAAIDYVLKETGEKNLDAIGFSLGTTGLFCLLCQKPEYNEKIRRIIAIAPAVYLGNARTPLTGMFDRMGKHIIEYGASTGNLEMGGEKTPIMRTLFRALCQSKKRRLQTDCLSRIGGRDNGNIEMSALRFYTNFFPDSTSLRTVIHIWQMFKEGRFCKYNYGPRLNMVNYGTETPPDYDLSNVKTPVHILWSKGDYLIVEKDVKKLMAALPNLNSTYEVPDKTFSHVDFIWAKTAHILVNGVILKILDTDISAPGL